MPSASIAVSFAIWSATFAPSYSQLSPSPRTTVTDTSPPWACTWVIISAVSTGSTGIFTRS